MTRQEAAEYFARKRDTLIWGLKDNRDETRQAHDAYNEAIVALCGPRPDPITGLVPCGCGGKAETHELFGHYSGTYMTDCKECATGTTQYNTETESQDAWNTAMGWKGGAE